MTRAAARRASWRDHPIVQLTLVRIREFSREPEAVFWAIFFPILLTTGLGVAFRSQPQPVLQIATTTPELAAALRAESGLAVDLLPPEGADQALRLGKVALLAVPAADGAVTYRYDPTNP